MAQQPYIPIACGRYEQFELAIMRGQWLDIRWQDAEARHFAARLLPKDLRIWAQAEHLIAEDEMGAPYRLRLDWIEQATPAQS